MEPILSPEASSKEMLGYYLAKSYSDAAEAKARGEKICWASSIAPCELCETMGIHVLYPENHSAAVAAKHGAEEMIQVAENNGYSLDICSYARINLAYMDVQQCVAGNIRELRNVMERLAVTSDQDLLALSDLDFLHRQQGSAAPLPMANPMDLAIHQLFPIEDAVALVEKELLTMAKEQLGTNRNVGKALGIDHGTVSRKLRKYNITGENTPKG